MMSIRRLFVLIAAIWLFSGCTQQTIPEEESHELPRDLEVYFMEYQSYTPVQDLTLSLFARDASECRFSDDGEDWGSWEPFQRRKNWSLSGEDGPKAIFFQCRNSAGDLSIPVSTNIMLDRTPPALDIISPSEGSNHTGRFSLTFTATDSVSQLLRCTAKLDGAALIIGTITSGRLQNLSIPAADGSHELFIQCRDSLHKSAGNISFTVNRPPSVAFTIDSGASHTTQRNVTLNLASATATECRFSNTKADWSQWQPFGSTIPWELPSGEGLKTVTAQCRDSRGLVSPDAKDTITIDTSPPPYLSMTIDNGAQWTASGDVILGLYAFAADQCRFSNDGISWSQWESYRKRKSWQLLEGEGEKTVYYNCRKKDGTDIGTISSSIDQIHSFGQPPADVVLKIDGGNEFTSLENVPLELSAKGALECRLRQDEQEWGDWEDYTTSKVFTLSGGDGAKTLHYQCRNDIGTYTAYSRIYLDRTPPGEVSSLTAMASEFAVHLFWGAATDTGSGVKLYNIFRKSQNGSKSWAGLTSGLSYKDERVVSGESYQYSTQAVDNNNNYGKESAPVNVYVP